MERAGHPPGQAARRLSAALNRACAARADHAEATGAAAHFVANAAKDNAMRRHQHTIPGRMMEFVDHVGDSIRDHMPSRAGALLQTGAALGMARTGTHVAGHFIRRHPAAILAAVAGAGVAWYVVHRYRKKQQAGLSIDGKSRRLEPQSRKRRTSSEERAENSSRSGSAQAHAGMDTRTEE